MTLAYLDPEHAAGPRTHALIIGVGTYDHLPGGSKERDRRLGGKTFGMERLVSPPESARAFARWLLGPARCPTAPANSGLNNPNASLGSVGLLITDPSPVAVGDGACVPSMPCVQEVERAYNAWFERANQFDGSIVLFYFCGHGVNWSDSRLPQISPRSPLDQCNQRANNHHESRPMAGPSNQVVAADRPAVSDRIRRLTISGSQKSLLPYRR